LEREFSKLKISIKPGLFIGGIFLLIFVGTILFNSISLIIGVVTLISGIAGGVSLTISLAKIRMKKCVFYQSGFCELSKCPVWGDNE